MIRHPCRNPWRNKRTALTNFSEHITFMYVYVRIYFKAMLFIIFIIVKREIVKWVVLIILFS